MNLFLLIMSILILFCVYIIIFIYWRFFLFFRCAKRKICLDDNCILCPADGFVVYCKKIKTGEDIFSIKNNRHIKLDDLMFIDDKNLLNQPGWLIGVVMTILDEHYNRSPITGYITKIKHVFPTQVTKNKSLFNVIQNIFFNVKPYLKNCDYILFNERASYIIKNDTISIYVTQIADQWINKIVTMKNNEKIEQGEIFGLIKMGSQVDIFIPDKNNEFQLLVRERQRVRAGITKLMVNKNKS